MAGDEQGDAEGRRRRGIGRMSAVRSVMIGAVLAGCAGSSLPAAGTEGAAGVTAASEGPVTTRQVAAWTGLTKVWTHKVPRAEQELASVAWSMDSRRLAILTDTNRHIQLLDRADGDVTAEIRAQFFVGTSMKFVNQGRNIVTARWNDFDPNPDPFTEVLTVLALDPLRVERHVQGATARTNRAALIAVSADGRFVATHTYGTPGDSAGGGVTVYASAGWAPLAFFPSLPNHLTPLSLAISGDGKSVIVGGYGDLRVCDVASASCGSPHEISLAELRFLKLSGNGQELVVGLADPGSFQLPIRNGTKLVFPLDDPANAAAFTRRADEERNHMLRILKVPELDEAVRVRGIVHQQVDALDTHRSLPLIAVASAAGVQLVDTDSGEIVATIGSAPGANRVTSTAFSPDGECLAIGFDTQVSLYCLPAA